MLELHGLPSLGSFGCLFVLESLQQLVQRRGHLLSFARLEGKADCRLVDVQG